MGLNSRPHVAWEKAGIGSDDGIPRPVVLCSILPPDLAESFRKGLEARFPHWKIWIE